MDFFYREKPWYAGQFVRKITPKFEHLTKGTILFMSTVLNKQKKVLLSVLVRDVNKTFLNTEVSLPVLTDGKIDFSFMDNFTAELEAERTAELEAYLTASGLSDYTLTKKEQQALEKYKDIKFKNFDITDVFDVKNSHNILSEDIVEGQWRHALPLRKHGRQCRKLIHQV